MQHEYSSAPARDRPEGRYANYFQIGHNAFEFILDFGQFFQENEVADIHTRIVISPAYAKALLETLRQSVEQHEQAFGRDGGE